MDLSSFLSGVMLFCTMGIVGLELSPEDFRRVARFPTAVIVGTLGQLVILPLGAMAVITLFSMDPVLAGGLVLVVAAPGGGISNIFTYLAGANIALSVTLTAITSLLAAFSFPLITSLGFGLVFGEGARVDVPVASMIGQLVVAVLVPIGIGMRIRALRAEWVLRSEKKIRRAVGVVIAVLLTATIFLNRNSYDSTTAGGLAIDSIAPAAVYTAFALFTGFGIARACGLVGADVVTFGIEYATKNLALSTIVAVGSLERIDLALFQGVYGGVAYPALALLCVAWRRRQTREALASKERAD